MVRLPGIEPGWLSPRDFKSLVSTYFTTVALFNKHNYTETKANCQIFFGTPGESRTHIGQLSVAHGI